MYSVRQRGYKQLKHMSSGEKSSTRMMRGTRLFKGGVVTDIILLVVFLILAYIFIVRRSNLKKVDEVVGEMKKSGKGSDPSGNDDGSAQHLIDARIKKIPDFRSNECRGKQYGTKDQVSIVAVFFDYQFIDLKTTLSSVLLNTPDELIKEILIIDDASTLDYIIDKSKAYTKSVTKARLIRNDHQMWTSGSRMRGFKDAKSEIVVFLDSNVVVSRGWLEPLIALVKQEPKAIVIPHYDQISNPVSYEYQGTKDSTISSMSWSLSIRTTSSTLQITDKTAPISSPTNRGNILAVSKTGFQSLGGYDEGIQDGGGTDLELSLRAWLCGSKVLVSPCSRVGIVNLQDPIKIVSPVNVRRITELWFSGRKNLVFRNTGIVDAMNAQEQESYKSRKAQIGKLNLQCQDIEWFFQNVAGHLPTPSEKAVKFGLLRCKTGRCAQVGQDKRIELDECRPENYDRASTKDIFEYTEDGLITANGQCVTVHQTAYTTLEECGAGDTKQKWTFKDGKLINDWSHYCLMHVTDPDKDTDGKRQIAMAQDCSTAPEPQFTSFEFITL